MRFVEHEKEVPLVRYITKLIRALHYGEPTPAKPEELTWRDIFTHAYTHSVAGVIWYVLEETATVAGEDEELIRRWSRERDLDFVKGMQQTRLYATLKARFGEEGIDYLPMKGLLIRTLWVRPEYRTMSDLDILVRPEHVEAAHTVLKSLGFTLEHSDEVHDSFVKPPYLTVELHRILHRGSTMTFDELTPSSDVTNMYEMSNEDFLTFILRHMYKHYQKGCCGIRSLFDLKIYLEAYGDLIDKELLDKKLADADLTDFYNKMLTLSEFWYGDGTVTATEEILQEEYYISGGATYGTVDNRVRYEAKTQGKLAYIFSRAFLPFGTMKKIYPWLGRFPFLLPVAWVMRWFSALFNGRLKKEAAAISTAEWKKNDEEID